ncbi:MAG: hypothetical protein JWO62_2574 [Acidimicrobiaceae bacterium]|nr:hypothetical protein [Acidimicrobiaceae bacterium]
MAKTQQVSIKTGGIGLDTTDFARFAKALRKSQPELAKGLQVKLRAAGMIVAAEAAVLAGSASVTIPPSIKVRVSGATISVVAGGNGIPLAGLMEIGNKGASQAGAADFRHPVFGDMNVWVAQSTHPFLTPALQSAAPAAEAAAVEALDEAIAIALGD